MTKACFWNRRVFGGANFAVKCFVHTSMDHGQCTAPIPPLLETIFCGLRRSCILATQDWRGREKCAGQKQREKAAKKFGHKSGCFGAFSLERVEKVGAPRCGMRQLRACYALFWKRELSIRIRKASQWRPATVSSRTAPLTQTAANYPSVRARVDEIQPIFTATPTNPPSAVDYLPTNEAKAGGNRRAAEGAVGLQILTKLRSSERP